MAQALEVRRPSENEAHKQIVRELRRYSATSIVDVALQVLWEPHPNRVDALQAAPWHVLLLVKWAFRDPHVPLRVGLAINRQTFDALRQRVQDLVGLEYRRHPPENIFLMLRAHLQQVDFQRPEGWGFLRWAALIARQPSSHPSRRQFDEHLGLTPEHFMDLAFGLFAAALGDELPISLGWFESLRPQYGASVDAIWRLVARDFAALRDELRRDHAQRLPLRQELYEFPYLKRFPFVRLRDGRFHCWHPMVLARGLEDIVHLKLSTLQGEYTEPFSRLFEQYVWELAQTMDASAIVEDQYRAAVGHGKPMVEAVIPCGDCNVLVEAKMSLFGDDVVLTDNQKQAFQKTKRVRDAIKQAWAVGQALRTPGAPFPNCGTAPQDFLLLVTSRELFLGGGEMLRRLYQQGDFDYPDDRARTNMPLHNVFVVSIENFERLSLAVTSGAVSLPALLKEAAVKNQDPSTSAILFDDFLKSHVHRWGETRLIREARLASERRLRQALTPKVS